MLVKAHCLEGQTIVTKEKELPKPKGTQVQVKGLLCGICGSDTAVFYGKEHYMGDEMWGHEGLGIVNAVGEDVTDFVVGDIVATYFHPSFWEYYNVEQDTLAQVPQVHGKYIIQPIACPLNALYDMGLDNLKGKRVLVIGSGFMAYIFCKYLQHFEIPCDNFGNYNVGLFNNRINQVSEQAYDYVIIASVSDKYELALKALKIGGTLVNYATPRFDYCTNFFKWNWHSITALFPSPRGKNFKRAFRDCVQYVDVLDYEKFLKEWGVGEMEEAFLAESTKKGLVKNFVNFRK